MVATATKRTHVQVTHDRLLVKPDDPEKMTAGGLILPDVVQVHALYKTGVVMGVGPGAYIDGKLIAPCAKVGDRVLYPVKVGSALQGMEITINEQPMWILSNTSVIAILTEDVS